MNAVQRHAFRAMGCEISIIAVDAEARGFALDAVWIEQLAEAWEQRFSRFRPESELNRLNRAAGTAATISRELCDMLEIAIDAATKTGGLVTPLMRNQVEAAGYRGDFRAMPGWSIAETPRPARSIDAIELDAVTPRVCLAPGAGLDLAGVAKSAFIDTVAGRFSTEWPGGCVNAGGDLRVWGASPDGPAWTVGIEYPQRPDADFVQATLPSTSAICAVATSGRNQRRWQTDRGSAHHLIDPRTGAPAGGSIVTATAFAASALAADIAAKALFLTASRGEPPLLVDAAAGLTIDERGLGTIWSSHEHLDHDLILTPLVARTSQTG